ncbi:ABC transporter substrate-binding protein [Archangium gephyra]|uniref:ABC transporter substrate-binding protein n=1 Tax=Archangium gephyra TaxID=48 RepID=UPI0035D49D38
MPGRWRLIVLILPVLLLAPDAAAPGVVPDRPMRVAFIDTLAPANPWRGYVLGAMHAAASDLGIELTHHPVGHWPGDILERARQVMTGPGKPDYLLVSIHRGIGTRLLELSQETHVPVFVFNSGLLPEDAARVGGPRGHFPLWLGQLLPDEEDAGQLLARLLLEAATRGRAPGSPVGLVAIEGRLGDSSALRRTAGLGRAVAAWEGASLLQGVSASWDAEQAWRKAALLLRRYPQLQVLWAANDNMALGALRAAEEAGRRPGEDFWVGGIDWTPAALQAVREGRMVTTLGGHFLEGAWALVLLHDYHRGRDFASEGLDWRTAMAPVSRDNVDALLQWLEERDFESIDFRAFSKAANPALTHYDFSLRAVFAQRRLRFPGTLLELYGHARPLPLERQPARPPAAPGHRPLQPRRQPRQHQRAARRRLPR